MIYSILSTLSSLSTEITVSMIAFIGTMIVAGISIYQNWLGRKSSKNNIIRANLIDKKNGYEVKLDKFYTPLRHHLEHSKTLYMILKKGKPENFRTLLFLLNKTENNPETHFDKNDESLMKAILKIGKKIEQLIHKKSYLIGDDDEFVKGYDPGEGFNHISYENGMTLLSLLTSHIVTIRMAFHGDLSGQVEKFKGFVFPNEINSLVDTKIDYLRGNIELYETSISKLR